MSSYTSHERLSTYIFDIMKLKILFLLNCESPKYIAKLFSLSIATMCLLWFLLSNVAEQSHKLYEHKIANFLLPINLNISCRRSKEPPH